MKISLNWLKDFTKITKTPSELSDLISAKLTEVEGFIDQKNLYDGILTVKIEELKKHPNSDHLWLVKVNTGKEILDIVCGAQNLALGQNVPLLPVGVTVPNTSEVLKEVTIRGEKSQGMLASARELNLGDDHAGIYILDSKIKPGTSLSEALGLDDVIFEIENKALTHRGDCFSVAGIAREVAAITGEKFIEPNYNEVKGEVADHKITLTIQNQVDCPRYLACLLQDVKVKPSPEYISRRLINSGLRPINNIVDITNYVCLEIGQPLHAFDAAKLPTDAKGNWNLGVRRANESEVMATLDDKERTLSNDNIVITAEDIPVAVAGIMGGASSEISEETNTVILEAANFNNFSIRKSSQALGLRSEASLRFEKGLDPNLAAKALALAVNLFKSEAGAKVVEVVEYYPLPTKPIMIITTIDFINGCLGTKLTAQEVLRMLTTLGFGVNSDKDALHVTVPTFRQDVIIAEDLVEEVARIYGYENIKPTLPQKDLHPVSLTVTQLEDRILRDNLRLLSYDEIYSYSFIGDDLYNKADLKTSDCLEIVNPLSADLKYIRDNIMPGLLNKIALNNHQKNSFKIFEIGKEIHPKHSELKNELEAPTIETLVCVGAVYNLDTKHLEEQYRKIKGEIEYLNAEKNSEITVVDSKILKNFGIKGSAITWKINLEPYFKQHTLLKPEIKDVTPTTPITEDISFYVDENTKVGDVIKSISSLSKLITNVEVFDVYNEAGKKSVALTISYSDNDKQLATSDVTPVRDNIIKTLEEKFGLEVRKS